MRSDDDIDNLQEIFNNFWSSVVDQSPSTSAALVDHQWWTTSGGAKQKL